jgi:hypothetical protein
MGVNFTNSGGAPVTLDLGLGGVVIQFNYCVNPGETLVATLPIKIFCDSESHLYVTVTSGDAFPSYLSRINANKSMRRLECQDAHLIRFKKCALLLETTKGNL